MTKAQSFFGGTNPKETGVKTRQVGTSSATPGVNSIVNNHRNLRTGNTVESGRPVQILQGTKGSGNNNHQMVRQGNTGVFRRPNIPGKVDNRRVGE